MGMENYVEAGWIITDGSAIYENIALFDKAEKNDNGTFVPGTDRPEDDLLYLETHPHDETVVFISLYSLCHGEPFPVEDPKLGEQVRKWVNSIDPEAQVFFGVIETRR